MTFQEWVAAQIEQRFRTATALAKAIGMDVSPFTRGVAAGTLNVVNLLRLAKVSGHHPSEVLRMAGKDNVADLLEDVYGGSNQTVSTADAQFLRRFKLAPAKARTSIETILRELVPDQALEEPTTSPKKRKTA